MMILRHTPQRSFTLYQLHRKRICGKYMTGGGWCVAGLQLAAYERQPEAKWLGLMIPYALLYPMWQFAQLVRVRVLVSVHLKGKVQSN